MSSHLKNSTPKPVEERTKIETKDKPLPDLGYICKPV